MIQVCDLVQWKNNKYRVSGHMKRLECVYTEFDDNDDSNDAFVGRMMNEIIQEEMEAERQNRKAHGLPHERRYKLVWCKPEEATHVNLSGVCGATAPIAEVEFEGVVDWSPEIIAIKKQSALRYVGISTFPHYKWE